MFKLGCFVAKASRNDDRGKLMTDLTASNVSNSTSWLIRSWKQLNTPFLLDIFEGIRLTDVLELFVKENPKVLQILG